MRRKKPKNNFKQIWRKFGDSFSVFRYSKKAVKLVWQTSPLLTILLAILTLAGGVLPAAIAYVGKLIVDAVVSQSSILALQYVALEGLLVISLAFTQRSKVVCQSLLRVLLAQKVNVLILEKALQLDLVHFEDSEFYDKMTRARREASQRPLSLVTRTFSLVEDSIALITYSGLLLQFSVWAVIILAIAALPSFIAETRFAGEAFRLFRWRSPETREQTYLEILLAREDFAKEVKLYQLGQTLLQRYRNIFQRLYHEDRNLTLRRGFWTYLLSLFSTATFYLAYAWIVLETISAQISIGDMTMYLVIFRQGQSTFSAALTSIGGMYEDNLYLSNLYEFLEQKVSQSQGNATTGIIPGDGVRFENVSFTYPGREEPALENISLHLQPGEKLALVGENGSGKTTLIKLLTRLYVPTAGKIFLDGVDLQAWDLQHLHQRISVIFQDFVRYQFTIGENVGVGDVSHLENSDRWKQAAQKGMAKPFIDSLPEGFFTQLGRWFRSGVELSGGQWQKIALSRAFMRSQADILVLDEPTSAMDAEAEAQIFERLSQLTKNQIVILISHRFSTVRMADKIVVLSQGKVIEQGTHEELLAANGRYARLFTLQAAGYQ
ncbi:ABC transporter ATP-binding protein [Oscillatoria salina]|uniref:ABC transporter ATP-binding protein n=1 Tax=Oscillatoria salina TaxID=331517 RepID=UPI0013BB71AA|nr:ABC transporter ATP-binding protein [Oscillatoria salina]MBZ8181426.1 ABC transporter ATP-binding protein [Oscillatoria salina IIICB1]NET88732.1 ABC transporter ATP-binding protein [Kamptonema sp. SIO1D9]